MKLNEGIPGHSYRVDKLSLPLRLTLRLEVLGMTGGTTVLVMNTKSHGTMIIKIRGTRFALGKGIWVNIDVVEVKD